MSWPREPRGHGIENASWALEDGRSFWDYVDSTPAYGATYQRCDCTETDVSPECPFWTHRRDDTACLAANSSLGRCSSWAVWGTPFCDKHLTKAWEALWLSGADRLRSRYESDLAMLEGEHEAAKERLFRSQQLETALLWDAAAAASTLPERVYFFAADYAVKVGRSVHPERRVKSLSGTKAPADVNVKAGRLLGTIPGSSRVEGELHKRFRRHRLTGEWFLHAPIAVDIDALIADHAEAAA